MVQEAEEDVTSDTMVFDHVHRMEKLDGSQRDEYETSLKLASVTSFLGKTTLAPISDSLTSLFCILGATETVCGTCVTKDVSLTKSPDEFDIDEFHACNGQEPTCVETRPS